MRLVEVEGRGLVEVACLVEEEGMVVVEDLEVDGLVEGEAMRVEVTVVVEVAVEEEETVAEEALTDTLMQRIFAQ